MPVPLTDVVYGFVIPALVAAMLLWMLQRRFVTELGTPATAVAAPVGLIVAFVIGYALLGLGQWMPKFSWHWLPYVALLTLPVGPLLAGSGALRYVGYAVCAVVAIVAAWLLIPTWPHLQPPRWAYLAVTVPLMFVTASLLDRLTHPPVVKRIPSGVLASVLTAAAMIAAPVIFLSGRASFTQFAGVVAGAMLGLTAAARFSKSELPLRGIGPSFAILVSGLLVVAETDSHSDVPWASYLLIPLAPLTLWLAAIKPIERWKIWPRYLLLCAVPLVVLLIALGLAVAAEMGGQESSY